MAVINYLVANTAIAADTSQPVLVAVPGTKEIRVTPTYAGQVLPGHQVLMSYGDSKKVAAAIISGPNSELGFKIEEERLGLQMELESLGGEIEALKAGNSSRAIPFLQYAQDGGLRDHSLIRKIQNREELSSAEADAIASSAYNYLRRNAGATSSVKDAIRSYIRSGEANNKTIDWFTQNIDPVFGKFMQYNDLAAKLEQLGHNVRSLEEVVAQAVEAIKFGNEHQRDIEVDGLKVNVDHGLLQLTGTKPGKYFLSRVDEAVEEENSNGLIVPFQYKVANGTNIPEELKSYFMSTMDLARIIALFDRTLTNLLFAYASKNQEIIKIAGEFSQQGIEIKEGVFMRAIFPENHQPTLTLYSDARIKVADKEEGIRLMEIVRNNRREVPRAAEEYFGMPEGQIKFEELVALQAQLMQLLPFPVYVCANMNSRFRITIDQAKKHRAHLTPEQRVLLARYQTNESQLQRDFGFDLKKISGQAQATLDEAIQLFGEEFGFIQKVTIKDK